VAPPQKKNVAICLVGQTKQLEVCRAEESGNEPLVRVGDVTLAIEAQYIIEMLTRLQRNATRQRKHIKYDQLYRPLSDLL